jgi:hypothetical protein
MAPFEQQVAILDTDSNKRGSFVATDSWSFVTTLVTVLHPRIEPKRTAVVDWKSQSFRKFCIQYNSTAGIATEWKKKKKKLFSIEH